MLKPRPLYLDCLKKRQVALGDTHRDTLSSMKDLAALYSNQGKYAEAKALYLECLKQRQVDSIAGQSVINYDRY